MLILSLVLINFLFATFDAWLTCRRIKDYGPQVELNKLIRWLSTRLGPELGVLLGIFGPVSLQTYLFVFLDWPVALGILIGLRLKMFWIQLLSLVFEKDIKKFIAENNLGRSSANPSSRSVDDSASLSQTPPTSSSKDKE